MSPAKLKLIIANKIILVVKSHRQSLYVLMYNVYKGLTINDFFAGPLPAVRPNRLLRASLVSTVATNRRRGVLPIGYDSFLSILVTSDSHMHRVLRVVD